MWVKSSDLYYHFRICTFIASLVAQTVKNLLQCGRPRFNSWVGKIPTAVFLPGEFHGQRNLVGYSPWDCKGLDTTERLTLSRQINKASCADS